MRSRWFALALAVLAAGASFLVWSRLPPQVPTHWNFQGLPDGFSSRLTAALFGPIMLVVIAIIANVLPHLDPRRGGYPEFRATLRLLLNLMAGFGLLLHVAILANGAGAPVPVVKVIGVGIGLLLMAVGIIIRQVEPNWFLGIRTPWTMDDPEIWRKTHRIGGVLFIVAGAVTIVATLVPGVHSMYAAVGAAVVAGFGAAVVSFVLWVREQGSKGTREQGSKGTGEQGSK